MASGSDLFSERLTATRMQLSPAEQLVASWLDRHRIEALAHTALEIGSAVGTSDATVVRTVRAMGFNGLAELRHVLATSLQYTPEPGSGTQPKEVDQGSGEAITNAVAEQSAAVQKLSSPKTMQAIASAVKTLNPVDRICVFGVGPSEFPAQYAAFLLNRYGREVLPIHLTGLRLADQLMSIKPGDGLLILSFGKAFQEVAAIIHEGRRNGLPMVLVTDDAENKFGAYASATVVIQRCRVHDLSMHGATFILMETLAVGLAAADPKRLTGARDRLNELRAAVGGPRVR